MLITVTNDDIVKGNASTDACPITIALRRHFGNKISVSRDFIRVPKKRAKNTWKLIPLPRNAKNFLLNYSRYLGQQPFSFELTDKNIKDLKA